MTDNSTPQKGKPTSSVTIGATDAFGFMAAAQDAGVRAALSAAEDGAKVFEHYTSVMGPLVGAATVAADTLGV